MANVIDTRFADQTIDSSNYDTFAGTTVVGFGPHTLTVDGVVAGLYNSNAQVDPGISPTFLVKNDGALHLERSVFGYRPLADSLNLTIEGTGHVSLFDDMGSGGNDAPYNVSFTGAGTGSLSVAPGWFSGDGHAIVVNGIKAGDRITIPGADSVEFTYEPGIEGATGTGVLTFASSQGAFSANVSILNMSPQEADAIFATMNGDGAYQGDEFVSQSTIAPVCFLRGTLILTDKGEIAVQELQVGDRVVTGSGLRAIKWIGLRNIALKYTPVHERKDLAPVRIVRDAIAAGVPTRDLLVSPGHHLLIENKLIRAKDIVNGVTIYQEIEMSQFEYFHVELEQFDVISAHGLMSESWADGGNRDFFQNVDVTALRPQDRQRRLAQRPGFDVLRAAREIAPIQARLAARSVALHAQVLKNKAA